MRSAPPPPSGCPSSAGWKMNFTLPASWSFMPASTSAAPMRIATWLSWPQACITPTSCPLYCARTRLLNGRSTCSVTGSPSMSARSATTGPGRPPLSTPTTPVPPTPVRTSMPSDRRCSATNAAVRTSKLESSGCSWMSRRQAITLGIAASVRRSISACRRAGWADSGAGEAAETSVAHAKAAAASDEGTRWRMSGGTEGEQWCAGIRLIVGPRSAHRQPAGTWRALAACWPDHPPRSPAPVRFRIGRHGPPTRSATRACPCPPAFAARCSPARSPCRHRCSRRARRRARHRARHRTPRATTCSSRVDP